MRQRAILIGLSVLATTVICVIAVSSLLPMMRWLDRHPGAGTVLRITPLISVPLVTWANYRRTKRQPES